MGMCQKNCGTTVKNALSSIRGSIKSDASFELSYASVTIDLDIYYDDNVSLMSLDELITTANQHQEVEDKVIETIENIGFDCRILLPNEVPVQKKQLTPVLLDEEEYEIEDYNDNNA